MTTRSALVAIARSLAACVFVTAKNAGISDPPFAPATGKQC
jgi:hypothetical protein